jgi:hypothetical protein
MSSSSISASSGARFATRQRSKHRRLQYRCRAALGLRSRRSTGPLQYRQKSSVTKTSGRLRKVAARRKQRFEQYFFCLGNNISPHASQLFIQPEVILRKP